MSLITLVLVLSLSAGQAAQGTASGGAAPPPPADGSQPPSLPVSLERIREALSQPPAIKPDAVRPVFRVEVIGEKPTTEDLLGKEFWKGTAAPTPGGAVMTHQEFLAMVTPPEFRGTAMFTQGEAMTVMATSVALQWALQRAIQKYKDAREAGEREAARKEVEEALKALDKAREAAGLPRR